MEKFIPYEKLSKKEKRKLDHAQRGTWGSLNPLTRKPKNSRAYNRKKAQSWKKDFPNSVLFCNIPLLGDLQNHLQELREVSGHRITDRF